MEDVLKGPAMEPHLEGDCELGWNEDSLADNWFQENILI